MGTRFPEFDLWREEAGRDAEEERGKMQAIEKMAFEVGGDLGLLVRKMKAQLAEKETEMKRLKAEVTEKERLIAKKPTPRLEQPHRIGRNDPCPCGSGKKFKHCCMRR
jgi:uncharacterized protein YecA (UPF0149 family)